MDAVRLRNHHDCRAAPRRTVKRSCAASSSCMRAPRPRSARNSVMLRSILDLDDVEVCEIMMHRRNVDDAGCATSPRDPGRRRCCAARTRGCRSTTATATTSSACSTPRRCCARSAPPQQARKSSTSAPSRPRPGSSPTSTTLLEQLQAFRQRREHFALVVDEYGALHGRRHAGRHPRGNRRRHRRRARHGGRRRPPAGRRQLHRSTAR